MPLLAGKIYDPNYHVLIELPSEIYFAYGAFFILVAYFAFYVDAKGYHLILPNEKLLRRYSKSLSRITSVLFIIIIFLSPRGLLPENIDAKSASELGIIWVLYRVMAISFFTCTLYANSKVSLLAIFFILTTLSSGSRTYFVLAILIYLIWRYYGRKIRIATTFIFIAGVPTVVMLLTIYKTIYQYLLILDFDSLLNMEKMLNALKFKTFNGSEAVVTLSFVHGIDIWKSNYTYDFSNIVLTTIPLLTDLIQDAFAFKVQAFSDFLEPLYFYDVGYGVASNLWGSMYAAGGFALTILIMYCYLLSFYIFTKYSRRRKASTVFIFPIMILFAFYATRWELAALIYMLCASYFCYFVVLAFNTLLQKNNEYK